MGARYGLAWWLVTGGFLQLHALRYAHSFAMPCNRFGEIMLWFQCLYVKFKFRDLFCTSITLL